MTALVSAVLALSAFQAQAQLISDLPTLGDADSEELSPSAERKLGEEIMKSYKASGAAYNDREAAEWLNRFGARITAAANTGGQGFEFFLVKDPTLNAFAMPGGFIGVNTGLIATAQSESELASVLAHEIGHVTQRHIARMLGKQKRNNMLTLAAMAAALLAARSSADAGAGLMMATMGASTANQLSFSRDAEREADRVGYQTLTQSDFDPYGMVSFFTRLQKSTRLYENNAPAYLRTHPLTGERISDIQNRVGATKARNRPDSIEFQLIRAKMRSLKDESIDGLKSTITYFANDAPKEGYTLPAAMAYGQSLAYQRLGDYTAANAALQRAAKSLPAPNSFLERLAIEIRLDQALKGPSGKRTQQSSPDVLNAIADDAVATQKKFSYSLAWVTTTAEALQRAGRDKEAESMLREAISLYRGDAELYEVRAKSLLALGKVAEHHLTLSEAYQLYGVLPLALEQAELARKSAGSDFYVQSQIDARIKVLRDLISEEKRAEGRGR